MRKKKIYLDTSVISYLLQDDAIEKMQETLALWELLRIGKYDVYISDVVVDELLNCPEPKRTDLFSLLSEIAYTNIVIEDNKDIEILEAQIKKLAILPINSNNDRMHIAAAIHKECNIIVSWNFKHMVNVKTIDGVRFVCVSNNINPIDIYSPTVLLERGAYDD